MYIVLELKASKYRSTIKQLCFFNYTKLHFCKSINTLKVPVHVRGRGLQKVAEDELGGGGHWMENWGVYCGRNTGINDSEEKLLELVVVDRETTGEGWAGRGTWKETGQGNAEKRPV